MELLEELGIFILIFFLFMKLRPQIMSKFEIVFAEQFKYKKLLENCPSLKKGRYFPTPYLSLGILQAIFGSKSKYADKELKFMKQYITFPNYGEFGVDWAYSDKPIPGIKPKNNKLVCIFPGICSPIFEPYIINIITTCFKEGYKVCLLNDRFYTNRDNGRGISFPTQGYFTYVDDYKMILEVIKKEHEGYSFYAIGHSFGANTLAKYLGQYHQENIFKAAVCVSNPWDFDLSSHRLSKSIDQFLMNSRKNVIKNNEKIFSDKPPQFKYSYEDVINTKTCREFDNTFSAASIGCQTVREYYHAISSVYDVYGIKVPTLFLQSRDDPILSDLTIPSDEVCLNPNLMMVITNTGGHVGWFEGFISPKRWYIKPCLEFINYFDSLNDEGDQTDILKDQKIE